MGDDPTPTKVVEKHTKETVKQRLMQVLEADDFAQEKRDEREVLEGKLAHARTEAREARKAATKLRRDLAQAMKEATLKTITIIDHQRDESVALVARVVGEAVAITKIRED